jgi:hypothetical protein
MKKLVFAASLVLALAGCSKKDPDPAPTPPSTPATPSYTQLILGKWVASSSTVEASVNGQTTIATTTYPYGDVSEVFTVKNVIVYAKAAVVNSSPYTVDGTSYTVRNGASTTTFDIISIDASSFVRRVTTTTSSSITATTTTLVR